ncbi:hypothetical protein BOX15_Mlig004170g2 [Macrostomum lignano]|nr:hypothetical protein BOX15_Mlig004170g2 [Macrostomum lignano]
MQLQILLGLLLSIAIVSCNGLTMSGYLSKVDKARLAGVFKASWPLDDAATAHYALLGLTTLGVDAPSGVCEVVKKSANPSNIEAAYHASVAASLAKPACSLGGALKGLEARLDDASLSAESLLQLVTTLKNEKLPLDAKKVRSVMDRLLKDDSSAGTVACVLLAGLRIGLDKADLAKFKGDMKDALLQADESDGQYLYYDKGVYTTALVTEALLKTTDKLGEAVAPADKLVKLANYLLSRRQIYQFKSAAQLLVALKSFADSSVQSPVVLFLKSGATLSKSSGSGVVSVQLADVWGRPVSPAGASMTLASAKNTGSGAVFLKDAAMSVALASERSVFNIDFMKAKPTVGFYQLAVSAKSSEKRFLFPASIALQVKVVSTVAVQSMEVAVADRDQQSAPVPVKLTYPAKAKSQLEADSHQRLSAKFQITMSGDNTPVTVHQAFIRLNHLTANKEAIFVAEPDKDKTYKFSVDLATGGKNLDYLSGLYAMELIVGDALIDKSLVWHLADVKLDLPDEANKPGAVATPQETERAALKPKPEIKHVFRQPDKMAPASIAMGFTILCLAPLAILLILWAYLGANLSGFVTSVPALLFHIGLAGILILYFFYWSCLNMFETLRYLCLLGVPTFICGNRLLRSLASGGSGGEKKIAE